MRIFFFTLLLFCFSATASTKDTFLESYIRQNNLNATIAIENIKGDKKYIYNSSRAKKRYLPASTFKIVNTLIALQEGAIKNEKEVIKWDGNDKGIPEWNKDQNLETAFPVSCVWFYQELAKRIGNDTYLSYLKKLHYGNEKTGKVITSFWLDGDLRISALEQINIMKNIYNKKYKFDEENYNILKRIMVVDKNTEYTIYAKTGWAMRIKPQIGWYVGYIETRNSVWFFACNMDIEKPERAKYRKEIVYHALRECAIIK